MGNVQAFDLVYRNKGQRKDLSVFAGPGLKLGYTGEGVVLIQLLIFYAVATAFGRRDGFLSIRVTITSCPSP
jgi:hypothetical protein